MSTNRRQTSRDLRREPEGQQTRTRPSAPSVSTRTRQDRRRPRSPCQIPSYTCDSRASVSTLFLSTSTPGASARDDIHGVFRSPHLKWKSPRAKPETTRLLHPTALSTGRHLWCRHRYVKTTSRATEAASSSAFFRSRRSAEHWICRTRSRDRSIDRPISARFPSPPSSSP